jgi:broad specificity phosphatase PhoE
MLFTPNSSFYFVRHGETDWNKENKIMGWKDIELNDNGREGAEHAAYILKELEIDKIYSSDLKRAAETAEIIAQICELEFEKMEGLRERYLGKYEGKTKSIGFSKGLSFLSDLNNIKDAELYKDFERRVINSINKIMSLGHMYPLIVSHGGVFQCLVNVLSSRKDFTCSNCEIFYFSPSVINKNEWDIIPIEHRF